MTGEPVAIGGGLLAQAAIFLAAAAVAAPLAKRLHVGSVLGYLAAGALVGPFGLGATLYAPGDVLHFAEFGIVLLLFLIGLELQPHRLWFMRVPVFGVGGAQVLTTAAVIALALLLPPSGLGVPEAVFVGLALSLSSTAFALQVLKERKEVTARHGRLAFAVLLFQDLAAIPLIALVPLFAPQGFGAGGMSLLGAALAIAVIAGVVLVGIFLLDHVFRLVAGAGLKEAMTALTLLTVIVVALLMNAVGLSAALGAFIAGALLSESAYRHEIEANIEPFQGLLLGLFFVAVGMGLDLSLLATRPLAILLAVLALVAAKSLVLWGLGRVYGLKADGARRFALVCSQGGEFAFVLLSAAVAGSVLDRSGASFIAVVVTLSMAATPLLLLADDLFVKLRPRAEPKFDTPPKEQRPVIIAGFGRFGQIVARILRARGIPFTALDMSPEQIALVKQFGNRAYYGDTSRLEILEAADAANARAFVLAVSDVDVSVKTAELVGRHFPFLRVYARARDRQHAYRLMAAGVTVLRRETFLSALDLTHELLRGLGIPETEARQLISTFRSHDDKRLAEDFVHRSDSEKLRAIARESSEELEELFRQDVAAANAPPPRE